jgi:hypothetical protein
MGWWSSQEENIYARKRREANGGNGWRVGSGCFAIAISDIFVVGIERKV